MDRSALPAGARLNEMEIIRVIAIGGFGIVYLARDHSLDREVAVKEFMPAHLVSRGQGDCVTVRSMSNAEPFALGLRSFVNEAKLLARFSHPAMVKVYRFWEANGTAYMAMPYLRGPTLRDVRRSMLEPPTEAWMRSILDPLLDALAMLHSEGVYHRDIAPDNVLVSGAGLPVLLDFGAARHLLGDRTQSLTAVLKPHYAPIEQYGESKQLRQGPWTDMYALAAVVTYLLDGLPPPASTTRVVQDEMSAHSRRHIPGVSTRFLSAIDWALSVRPQDRPQTVAEWRDALYGSPAPSANGLIALAPRAQDRVPFPVTTQWHRRPAFDRRFTLRALVAVAGVAVAVAVGGPLTRQARNDAAPVRAELAVQPSTPPAVAASTDVPPAGTDGRSSTPALRVAEVSSALVSAELSAPRAAQVPPIQARVVGVPKQRAPGVRGRAASGQRVALSHKQGGARVASAGPLELCAAHNFFVRPYCIQHRCDERRFRAHPACTQLRQLARARRD